MNDEQEFTTTSEEPSGMNKATAAAISITAIFITVSIAAIVFFSVNAGVRSAQQDTDRMVACVESGGSWVVTSGTGSAKLCISGAAVTE